jgi:hypothetical protein
MGEVHEGICESHQSAFKMKWMLRRAGLYWSTMVNDCVMYQKGCKACQRFRNVQSPPARMLHPIIKPWPFKEWGLDFIREVHPASSKGHRFILVATDYFTKWIEAVPLRNMPHREVINFVQEHIIHQFGVPQSLMTNQGSSFISHQFKEFAGTMKIKLLSSSPYYAQINGQVESSNKTLIKLIKKKIEESPRRWNEALSEALWAHRTSKHGATKVAPFELTYGQEAVLPIEMITQNCRVSKQDDLSAIEYHELMMEKVDEAPES